MYLIDAVTIGTYTLASVILNLAVDRVTTGT